jgi:hypothetical protein
VALNLTAVTGAAIDRDQLGSRMTGALKINGVIAVGYGVALLVATDPILELYGITPIPQGPTWPAGSGRGCWALGSCWPPHCSPAERA